ncbi:MAG: hypothetical protein JRJ29_10410 [Deltaproteobacteria bacterium]|nr:hypothetical protein [Deltaproteobacteria bacterium]
MKRISPKHKAALYLFLFFASFYYLTNAGGYKAGDESVMSALARQMAYKGKIGFDKTQYPPGEDPCTRGIDGLYHPKWGLGQSLVEVPFYFLHRIVWQVVPYDQRLPRVSIIHRLSEMLTVFICPSVISALGCTLVFLFGLRLGFSRRVSIVLSLIYGIGTMVWPYSKSLMSEATLNVAMLGGVYATVSYVSDRKKWWLTVSALCMGFALITKVVSTIVLFPLLVYLFLGVTQRRIGDIVVYFILPYLLFVGLQLWYNMIRYGDLLTFGYDRHWGSLGFCTPLYVGLWGLFLSPGKSFFLYTPISLLGLVSSRAFFKNRKAEALLFLGTTAVFTIPHSLWVLWAGDWAWGPRFLLPITPYLVLPIGYYLEKWPSISRLKKTCVGVLIAGSVFVQILGVTIHPFSFIESRWTVASRLLKETKPYTYVGTYAENAMVNFSPVFSHIVGNWWLFKHLILSYDLWKDVPWKDLGDFNLPPPKWVKDNRTIPFWWPISFSMVSGTDKRWIVPLALASFFAVVWFAVRLSGEIAEPNAPVGAPGRESRRGGLARLKTRGINANVREKDYT